MKKNTKAMTFNKEKFNNIWQSYGTTLIFLSLIIILALIKPSAIFTGGAVSQILSQSSVNILLALGEFFAILIAGIDLSIGSIAALVGMITAKMLVGGINPVLAVITGIFVGAFLGFLNGTIVNKTGVHPFIITLGSQTIFRGITLLISNARSVFGFPIGFTKLMSARFLGIPVTVYFALFIAALLWFFTTQTTVGRNIYALGGNKDAAWYSGIDTKLHTLIVFVISGTAAALAGLVLLGRVGAAEPAAGTGFETFAIAAAIIGGTSFFGGKGKIPGVVIGGLIIGLINYGMTALNIPSSYQQIVMGSLIIISVSIDTYLADD